MTQSLNNFKFLLLTLDFSPTKGGIANYLFGLCKYVLSKGEKLLILSNKVKGSTRFDDTLDFSVEIKRISLPETRLRRRRRINGILWILLYHD